MLGPPNCGWRKVPPLELRMKTPLRIIPAPTSTPRTVHVGYGGSVNVFGGSSCVGVGGVGSGAGGVGGVTTPSSASISSSIPGRQWRSVIGSAWRRRSGWRSSGSFAAGGIAAPLTSTGMTRIPRRREFAISRRTQSVGSSSRRLPCSSSASTQLGPMTAISASIISTACSIPSTKSTPGSRALMSMKTSSSPKWRSSQSVIRPASLEASSRR